MNHQTTLITNPVISSNTVLSSYWASFPVILAFRARINVNNQYNDVRVISKTPEFVERIRQRHSWSKSGCFTFVFIKFCQIEFITGKLLQRPVYRKAFRIVLVIYRQGELRNDDRQIYRKSPRIFLLRDTSTGIDRLVFSGNFRCAKKRTRIRAYVEFDLLQWRAFVVSLFPRHSSLLFLTGGTVHTHSCNNAAREVRMQSIQRISNSFSNCHSAIVYVEWHLT